MPATPEDARDLLVASVLCDDPVVYIDDRWLYEMESECGEVRELDLRDVGPALLRSGSNVTLVGCGYSTQLCNQAATELAASGIEAEVIDLRVVNPLRVEMVEESVARTGRLCVVDGGWRTCGIGGEVVARIAESDIGRERTISVARVCIADAPAPTSSALEELYYPTVKDVVSKARDLCQST